MNSKNNSFEKHNRNLPPIVHEDEWLIAFDKPSGMLLAPDRRDHKRGCLVNLIHEAVSPEAFPAHRLDADTSGVILFAKNKSALKTIALLFERREIQKLYLTLVHGAPPDPHMTVKENLIRDPARPGTMAIAPKGGMKAETKLTIVKQWSRHSLLEISPLTSKTHQIRVHLVHVGCPIIADNLYGSGTPLLLSEIKPNYNFSRERPETPLIGRLALHASSISFKHPATGKAITIEAPLPKDFKIAIKYLDKFSGTNFIQQTSN